MLSIRLFSQHTLCNFCLFMKHVWIIFGLGLCMSHHNTEWALNNLFTQEGICGAVLTLCLHAAPQHRVRFAQFLFCILGGSGGF